MRRIWAMAVLLVGACTGPVRSSAVYESRPGGRPRSWPRPPRRRRWPLRPPSKDKAHGRYLTQVLVKLLASWLYHDSRYVTAAMSTRPDRPPGQRR
jgi:hypothetical protein